MSSKIMLLFFSLFLLSCVTKKEKILLQNYQDNIGYNKSLQKSEKVQLYDANGSTVVMLTATYLNKQNFDIENKKDERFIIGIYINDDVIEDFSAEDFSITLNANKAKSFEALKLDDALLKNKSLIISWSKYYLVSFAHTNSKKFNLIFKSNEYGQGSLNFSKVAKYIYTKKAF